MNYVDTNSNPLWYFRAIFYKYKSLWNRKKKINEMIIAENNITWYGTVLKILIKNQSSSGTNSRDSNCRWGHQLLKKTKVRENSECEK